MLSKQEAALCPLLHADDLDLRRREAERNVRREVLEEVKLCPNHFQWKGTVSLFFCLGGGRDVLVFLWFVCLLRGFYGWREFLKTGSTKGIAARLLNFQTCLKDFCLDRIRLKEMFLSILKTLIRISAACVATSWAAEDEQRLSFIWVFPKIGVSPNHPL